MLQISVIIPVFNEERTIASIIEIMRSWEKANEIIVVDDGSTDDTLGAIQQFKEDIILIHDKKNHGKGYALAKGIEKARSDILVFMDGDVLGLTHKDLDDLVAPIIENTADMTVGNRLNDKKKSTQLFKMLAGERAVRRTDILPLADKMKTVGYGVELLLTNFYKQKRIVYVDLPYVSVFLKFEKQPVNDAMLSYIKEARELVTQAVRQQAGELTPQARRAYQAIAQYLKQALDYIQ